MTYSSIAIVITIDFCVQWIKRRKENKTACVELSSLIFKSKLVVCDVLIDSFMKDLNYSQNSCL